MTCFNEVPCQRQQSFPVSSTIRSANKENSHHTSPSVNITNSQHSTCCSECPSQSTHISDATSNTALPHLQFPNRIDINCETESNHDTALTLSCAGGHEELVTLLLHRGANIEHRDKKGFTPLILAGTYFYLLLLVFVFVFGCLIEINIPFL